MSLRIVSGRVGNFNLAICSVAISVININNVFVFIMYKLLNELYLLIIKIIKKIIST